MSSYGSFKIEAAISSLRRHVKNQEWLNLYELALPFCVKFSEENCEETQKRRKRFTKEQCDVKYTMIIWCLEIHGHAVSTCMYDYLSLGDLQN